MKKAKLKENCGIVAALTTLIIIFISGYCNDVLADSLFMGNSEISCPLWEKVPNLLMISIFVLFFTFLALIPKPFRTKMGKNINVPESSQLKIDKKILATRRRMALQPKISTHGYISSLTPR
jgi:hypothetical protein